MPRLAGKVVAKDRTGVRIRWLGEAKSLLRFLTAPSHKRHVVDGVGPVEGAPTLCHRGSDPRRPPTIRHR